MELSIFYLACNNLFYSVTALKVLDVAQGYAIIALSQDNLMAKGRWGNEECKTSCNFPHRSCSQFQQCKINKSEWDTVGMITSACVFIPLSARLHFPVYMAKENIGILWYSHPHFILASVHVCIASFRKRLSLLSLSTLTMWGKFSFICQKSSFCGSNEPRFWWISDIKKIRAVIGLK